MKVKLFNLKNKFFRYVTYTLDWSQHIIAHMIKIHPCNGLHMCNKEHEDDSESEIIQIVR